MGPKRSYKHEGTMLNVTVFLTTLQRPAGEGGTSSNHTSREPV